MNAPITTDYGAIDAVNWSTLVHLATSPRLMKYRATHPREETKALRLGTAIHCAILEPDAWPTRYVVAPDVDKRTKAGKEAFAEWRAGLDPAAVILDAEEHEIATRCAESVRAHAEASALLARGRTEVVLTWTDEATGTACKGRLDLLGSSVLLDVKSTRAESVQALAREIAGRLYHGQLAFYLDGGIATRRLHDTAQVYVLAVQTIEPFDVIPARLMLEDLERGRALYRSLLRKYAECRAAGWWPGLAPTVIDLPLPAWAAGGEPEQTGDEW